MRFLHGLVTCAALSVAASGAMAGQVSGHLVKDGRPWAEVVVRIECREGAIEVRSNREGYFNTYVGQSGYCEFKIDNRSAGRDFFISRVPEIFNFEVDRSGNVSRR